MTSDDGTQIALVFDETLGAVTAPAKSFTVAIGKTKTAVTNVSVEGPLVILDLASTISEGQNVVVSYVAPKASALTSNAAVQDESGNDAVKFSNISVENPANEDSSIFYLSEVNLVGVSFFNTDPFTWTGQF